MARAKKVNQEEDNNENNEGKSEKQKKLEAAIRATEKEFGSGTVQRISKQEIDESIEFQTTGILSLDKATGGGIPKGRIIEIYGPESGGKTTTALQIVAQVQKAGGTALFVDMEHALDPRWAEKIGVNVEELIIVQPTTGEEALSIMETFVRLGAVDIAVLDSVAALITKKELEGDMGDSNVGGQARLMSQGMRKLTEAFSSSKTIGIFINQVREKIGVMFGNPEVTTGGRALRFFSSIRIEVRKVETVKEGDKEVGNRVKAAVKKNKVGAPYQAAEYVIRFDRGIDVEEDVADSAIEAGLIEKSGSWFKLSDGKTVQGMPALKNYLRENKELFDGLVKQLM